MLLTDVSEDKNILRIGFADFADFCFFVIHVLSQDMYRYPKRTRTYNLIPSLFAYRRLLIEAIDLNIR